MKPTINIIGAGALGKTLGYLFTKFQVGQILGVCNTTRYSACRAVEFIGSGAAYDAIANLPGADFTFITTPDERIKECCTLLCQSFNLKKGSIVVHCSGSLSSEILFSIKNKSGFACSIHPMQSFADPELCPTNFNETYCAIEGDEKAIIAISSLFNAIGAKIYTIATKDKASYHAAGVFASNYVITLSSFAIECLKQAKVETKTAALVISSLLKSTACNFEKTLSPIKALTGPIQRGDISTIEHHIQNLNSLNILDIYKLLGVKTVSLTNHSNKIKKKILKALS